MSSYIDLLWDRSVLQEEIDRLLDHRAKAADSRPAPRPGLSLATIFAAERIEYFLANFEANDALLRQAIDVASLYLPRKSWHVSNVVSVVPIVETDGPARQTGRGVQGQEKRASLVSLVGGVLRRDFLGDATTNERSLLRLFSVLDIPLGPVPEQPPEQREPEQRPMENEPSFEAIRRGLTSIFYADPDLAANVADLIDYFPSFTVRLAIHVYRVIARISGWEPLDGSWRQHAFDVQLRVQGWFKQAFSRPDRRAVESPLAAALRAMQEVQFPDISDEWAERRRDPRDAFEAFCWFFVEYRNFDGGEVEPAAILRSLSVFFLRKPLLCYFLAKMLSVPVPFGIAFGEELDEIALQRAQGKKAKPEGTRVWRDPYDVARQLGLSGICLSGGGIRSATFNLGVLQALADMKMLGQFDYLSTVSGGGYIGSWLASWIVRMGSVRTIETLIQRKRKLNPLGEDIHPIRWLREYSHYLTPQSGAVTTDTLTMVAVYFRNMVLNQVLLLFVFAAILLFPLLWFPVLDVAAAASPESWIWLPVALVLCFSGSIGICLRRFTLQSMPGRLDWRKFGSHFIWSAIVLPAIVGSILVTFAIWREAQQNGGGAATSSYLIPSSVVTAVGLLIAHLTGSWEPPRNKLKSALYIIGVLPPAFVAGWCFEGIRELLQSWNLDSQAGAWTVLVFGPPLVLAAWGVTIIVYLGIVGLAIGEERREWWARLGAVIGAVAVGYLLLTSSAVYGPLLIWRSTSLNISLASIWAVVSGLGLKFGAARGPVSVSNRASALTGILKGAVIAIAPFVFIGGLFLGLSWGLFWLTAHFGFPLEGITLSQHYWEIMGALNRQRFILFLIALAGALLLGRTLGVNEFSMHNFYKNRLVRAYLAASRDRKQRRPNPFTGFDLFDDIPLSRFQVEPPVSDMSSRVATLKHKKGRDRDAEEVPSELQPSYFGPFLIMNATLNVTKGQDLALQERKAESFIFTPLRCGFQYTRPGTAISRQVLREFAYCRTETYAYESGPSVGAAMAISGAAANPNWGSKTGFGTAFLLTLFNARLGWWIGNPAGTKADRSSPRMGLIYLLYNLIGSAGSESNYINLSDGGHFDNSGLYELIRRRCKYIMICDAEQDAGYAFGALGSAIRKARIDFAAEVRIDIRNLTPVPGSNSKCHCAAGEIIYDDQTTACLIYLKLSLDGAEPTDVFEYKKRAPAFPHQSTTDQFFSESQFESYRMLGYYSTLQTWNPAKGLSGETLADTFGSFKSVWPEPSSVDTELRPHYDQVLSAHTWGNAAAVTEAVANERVALMHRLFHELRLSDQKDRVINKGIVQILRTWKQHPVQCEAWRTARLHYERTFILFYDNL